MKFIETRIKDTNITSLVRKMLKAVILKDYVFEDTEEGQDKAQSALQ